MRVINKQISLEHLTSRLPGTVPAYANGKVYHFDDDSLREREYTFPSNYGMIPLFVVTRFGCLSWERLSEWYHFFSDYIILLNDSGSCGAKYKSALDYYENESKRKNNSRMKYGSIRQTYVDIDALFKERGGYEFYSEICEKYIPSVEIPTDYADYWHSSKLFYPDIVRWVSWFNVRYMKYGDYESSSDCSIAVDCCDCTEYFNRGGNTMKDILNECYNRIQTAITTIETCSPFIQTDVSIQTSLDNIGEFSIFSEEYKLGTDYRVAAKYGDTTNTKGGTVVSISGEAMVLKDGVVGFDFNPVYMEKIYNEKHWSHYSANTLAFYCKDCGYVWSAPGEEVTHCPNCSSSRIVGVPEEDEENRLYQNTQANGYYAFDPEMRKVTGDTEENVREALAESYKVTPVSLVYVGGMMREVVKSEYGYYKGNAKKIIYVFRDSKTDTPYVVINGKVLYAETRPQTEKKYFYFPFFTTSVVNSDDCTDKFVPDVYKWFPKTRGNDLKMFVNYNGAPYEVTTTGVTIDGFESPWIIGYFSNDEGEFYFKNGYYSSDCSPYTVDEKNGFVEDTNYVYNHDTQLVKKNINEVVDVYEFGVVKGKTKSRLKELRSNNVVTDDVGNVLEGRYSVANKKNYQPPQGTVLDLIYEKGNIGRMHPIEVLNTGTTKFYFGDMITKMVFYYLDYAGDKVCSEEWTVSSLNTINSLTIPPDYKTPVESGTVYCDIEYVIGGTFIGITKTTPVDSENEDTPQLIVGNVYRLAGDNCSSGVTYNETVRFVRTQTQYELMLGRGKPVPKTKNSPSGNTHSYPVNCYMLEQFNLDGNNEPLAEFTMIMPPNSGWSGYSSSLEIYPVVRQEYMFGSSMPQSLDSNIYIERGVSAAFEKHLKLGEVTSMEALEQYGNGYFSLENK